MDVERPRREVQLFAGRCQRPSRAQRVAHVSVSRAAAHQDVPQRQSATQPASIATKGRGAMQDTHPGGSRQCLDSSGWSEERRRTRRESRYRALLPVPLQSQLGGRPTWSAGEYGAEYWAEQRRAIMCRNDDSLTCLLLLSCPCGPPLTLVVRPSDSIVYMARKFNQSTNGRGEDRRSSTP